LIVLCAIVAVAFALTNQEEWEAFKAKYQRSYANEDEEFYRYTVFQKNVKKAAERQAQELPGGATFGVTKFSDLTEEEFRSKYLMPKEFGKTWDPKPTQDMDSIIPASSKIDPTNYNWFNQTNVCTPIYNQGECGSCWAFSATETIESYWGLAGNKLAQLSMEQIVDCDTQAFGCGGGWPYWAYAYVMQIGGVDSYSSYPYTAEGGNSGTCAFNKANVVAQLKGYVNNTNGEAGLYKLASTVGPVSVCVDASSWSAYTGGVLTTCTSYVDHCVQLVGYGNYGAAFPGAFWIVRNSWGTDWGMGGFIEIAIGQDLCVIGDYATIVTVA